jgi:hypothetical protein
MKLEKWSMIAEIVASSAIVITLAILIVEVRANTSELQAATQDSIAARTQEIALAPVMNPQWAEVLAKFNAGEELTNAERAQVLGEYISLVRLAHDSFIAYRDGRLDDEIWQTRAAFLVNLMGNPQRRAMWGSGRPELFVDDFVVWLDAELLERYGE